MIVVNRDRLRVEWRNTVEYKPKLEDFLQKVAMIKPTCEFSLTDRCVEVRHLRDEQGNRYEKPEIYAIRVYENGEKLGEIGMTTRYRNGASEEVYYVSSFRIQKFRGGRNTTKSADIKVALREVKKSFVARENDELKTQIRNQVSEKLGSLHASGENSIRWDFDQNAELAFYAMEAYKSRQRGDKYTMMPVRPVSIKNLDMHDKKCEQFEHTSALWHMVKAKLGYGIKKNPLGSLVVYSFEQDAISKYNSFDELPDNIQQKYAMFKVLKEGETVTTIGCKLDDQYAYVV